MPLVRRLASGTWLVNPGSPTDKRRQPHPTWALAYDRGRRRSRRSSRPWPGRPAERPILARMTNPSAPDLRALFEQTYAAPASRVQEEVWQSVFGDEYPTGLDPYS